MSQTDIKQVEYSKYKNFKVTKNVLDSKNKVVAKDFAVDVSFISIDFMGGVLNIHYSLIDYDVYEATDVENGEGFDGGVTHHTVSLPLEDVDIMLGIDDKLEKYISNLFL